MKHTTSLLFHCKRIVKEATEKMNIELPKNIYTNQADFIKFSEGFVNYNKFMNVHSENICLFGCYDVKTDNIFLNIKEIKYLPDLDHTIIHELTHKKFPKLKHGIKFNTYIEKIEYQLSKCNHSFNNARQLLNMGKRDQRMIDLKMCSKCYLEIKYNEGLIK